MSFQVPAHIEYRVVQDEVILLDARTDAYHALNPAAALIWAVLAEGGTADAAVEALVVRFDVASKTAAADVKATIEELVSLGLLDRGAP